MRNYKPVENWKSRTRGGLPSMYRRQFDILLQLREAKDAEGYQFIPLSANPRTLRSLMELDYIVSADLQDNSYRITKRGLKALKVYEQPTRRYDGICPTCGIRPKHVGTSGYQHGWCVGCEREYKKFRYQNRLDRTNPDRLCSCCKQRPLHRMSGGKLSTYCTQCRNARRKAERRARHDRDLERIRNGEVLLCRRCKQHPRAYTDRYVRDYCPECQREYLRDYNDRRRPDSKAAQQRNQVQP